MKASGKYKLFDYHSSIKNYKVVYKAIFEQGRLPLKSMTLLKFSSYKKVHVYSKSQNTKESRTRKQSKPEWDSFFSINLITCTVTTHSGTYFMLEAIFFRLATTRNVICFFCKQVIQPLQYIYNPFYLLIKRTNCNCVHYEHYIVHICIL